MASECIPAFESEEIKPIVDKVFPMSEAQDALEYMKGNLNVGKIVLENDL